MSAGGRPCPNLLWCQDPAVAPGAGRQGWCPFWQVKLGGWRHHWDPGTGNLLPGFRAQEEALQPWLASAFSWLQRRMERLDQMSFIALNSNSWPIQSGQEKARFSPVYPLLHSSQQQVFTEHQRCARLYDKKHWQSSGELGIVLLKKWPPKM